MAADQTQRNIRKQRLRLLSHQVTDMARFHEHMAVSLMLRPGKSAEAQKHRRRARRLRGWEARLDESIGLTMEQVAEAFEALDANVSICNK